MSTKVIGLIKVTDANAFDDYRSRVGATVEKFNGHVRYRGTRTTWFWNQLDCGEFDAFVELEFPNSDDARHWAASDDYRRLLEVRHQAMRLSLFAVE